MYRGEDTSVTCPGNFPLPIRHFEERYPWQVNAKKKFRTAKLSIIHRRISLPAPQGKNEARDGPLPMIDLTAIMAIEKSPPNARDKLCWVLLTDLPVDTLDEAIEKVGWYSLRWRIDICQP